MLRQRRTQKTGLSRSRRGFMITAVGLALAAIAVSLGAGPAVARAADDFAKDVRATERRAEQRLAATERATRGARYAYYTVGDVWKYTSASGWAAGFVPGGLWSCYQMTGGRWWRDRATARQAPIGAGAITRESLNVGALFTPSFARGYRLTGDRRMRTKALRAAAGMAQRFDPDVGAMLSRPKGDFNVIIDSLMKSQMLWWAGKNGGSPELAEIARRHALTTARDFVRPDGSTYHIVTYDSATGAVLTKGQSSGYSDESTWARGQAWAILGFSAAYRESGDAEFLAAARTVSDWYLAHVPSDMVPYWDFEAPHIPLAPRDSSAAAIAASGLIDLALVDPDAGQRERYEAAARKTLAALMSPAYSSFGANPAVLLHGTYLWRGGTIDRGLAFGDAFFLEALLRLRRLAPDAAPLSIRRARASKGDAGAAVDGDLTTRWTSRGARALDLRLSRAQTVGAVRVALHRGDNRAARLRILVSGDRKQWRLVKQTMTSGETSGFETLSFTPRPARWVRVSCNGTTLGPANRLAEVEVYPAL